MVATLYRLWCKLRWPVLQKWQAELVTTMPWERAIPGTECLQVALRRAFSVEHHKALNRTVISVLWDLSNFYDRLDLERLYDKWKSANYPPLHAAFAMQVYLGSRILEAKGEASQPLWTRKCILAGDPQAPLIAKVYLQRALQAFTRKFPMLHVDPWIDDCSFDVVERVPSRAVNLACISFSQGRARS